MQTALNWLDGVIILLGRAAVVGALLWCVLVVYLAAWDKALTMFRFKRVLLAWAWERKTGRAFQGGAGLGREAGKAGGGEGEPVR